MKWIKKKKESESLKKTFKGDVDRQYSRSIEELWGFSPQGAGLNFIPDFFPL